MLRLRPTCDEKVVPFEAITYRSAIENVDVFSTRTAPRHLLRTASTDIFAGDPPPQPVALALADIIKKEPGVLTRRWFDRVLDARMVDLEQAQPETLVEMET